MWDYNLHVSLQILDLLNFIQHSPHFKRYCTMTHVCFFNNRRIANLCSMSLYNSQVRLLFGTPIRHPSVKFNAGVRPTVRSFVFRLGDAS